MAKMGKIERFFYSKRGEMFMGATSGIFAAFMVFIDSRQSAGTKAMIIFLSAIAGIGLGYLVWLFKIAIFGNKLEKTVWLHGSAYGRIHEYKCDLISRNDDEAVFMSRSGRHEIKLVPLYLGSKIGSPDIPPDTERGPATVCAFYWDGEYTALALFKEQDDTIEILVHEF